MDDAPITWHRGPYSISTDPARLDVAAIAGFLATTYWASDVDEVRVRRSLGHSLNFGLYRGREQVGIARVVTDRALFAFVCDVFIREQDRGRGLGRWLMESVMSHPDLQGLRRWVLATRDAHAFYADLGFHALTHAERWMEFAPASEAGPLGAVTRG